VKKAEVKKAEDRLVRAAVSYRKLYAVDEIPIIPLKVRRTVYIQNIHFNVSHVNVFLERKILNFLSFSSI
jgi:hypothetical protein